MNFNLRFGYVPPHTIHRTGSTYMHPNGIFFSLCMLFYLFYIFSTEHVLVLQTVKGLFLIFSEKPSRTPAASTSIHLLHCLYLVHRPSLPTPPWVGISLVFLPTSSTRREYVKGSDLACPLLPSASDPVSGTKKAWWNDLWSHTSSVQSPR